MRAFSPLPRMLNNGSQYGYGNNCDRYLTNKKRSSTGLVWYVMIKRGIALVAVGVFVVGGGGGRKVNVKV